MESKKEVAFLCTHKKEMWLFSGQFCKLSLLGTDFSFIIYRRKIAAGFQVMLVSWLALADAILDRHSANFSLSRQNILSFL